MNTSALSYTFRMINSRTHPAEWERAWLALRSKWDAGDDNAQLHPTLGECWQYMGTVRDEKTGRWMHTFRHRCHPVTGKREYSSFPASASFQAENQAPKTEPAPYYPRVRFDPRDCSGAFDGISVSSDADPGL